MDLTQQEQQFFESGGETALEAPETTVDTPTETTAVETPAVETPSQEPAKEPEKPKMVPLEALHEARGQNKDLRSELQASRARAEQMEKRFTELMERLTPAKAPAPAFEENPAEHLKAKVAELEQRQTQTVQQTESQQKEAQFQDWYRTQAGTFAAQNQDFLPAYNSFMETRAQELLNAGMAPQEIQAKIRQEERAIALTAAQAGLNPAQMIYQAALAKGYKPKPQSPQVSATEKLQNVENGIKSGKSLSNVPGRPSENMTLASVADMSNSEFAEFAKNWDSNMARLHS